MEFKFRAGDDRPPSSHSPSSSISFFSDQALRANYSTDPNFIRSQIEMYTIQREIEKEKIRLEIIAAENVRRRLLEEEVRRELMMEREAAVRGSSETGLSTEESHTKHDSMFPLTHKLDNRLLEDRLTFPGSRSLGFGLDMLPPILPQLSNAVTEENKSTLDIKKKEKLIILAKPDPNLCGVKRKAETPPTAPGELPFTNMKKKPKEEWSCALCEVSATSERGLNEHLQGRKHKAKEARLRAQAQKMRNNSSSSHSKESGKQTKVTVGGDAAANSEQKSKVEEQFCQPNIPKDASDRKSDNLDLKNKGEKLQKNQEKKNEKVPKKNQKAKSLKKKKLKFWCELCQVGAHSGIVMEGHKNGRKHLARLKEQNVNVGAVPAITTTTNMTIVASPKHTEKGKHTDFVAKEANNKTTKNDTLFEGANEKTGNGAVVLRRNEKGTENDAVVKVVNEETIANDTTVEEKVPENDAAAKDPSEKTIEDDAVVEANKKTAEMAVMAEEANGKMAEDDVMVEEGNEKTAGNGAIADEGIEKVAENDVVAEEAIAKATEDEVVCLKKLIKKQRNVGETD